MQFGGSYEIITSTDASSWPIGNFKVGSRPCSDNSKQVSKGYLFYENPKITSCERDMEFEPMLTDYDITEWSMLEENNVSDGLISIFEDERNKKDNVEATIDALQSHVFNLWIKPNKNWVGYCGMYQTNKQ